jgi:hypothetical protein
VLERLDDAHVRVLQRCVLADEHDGHRVEHAIAPATSAGVENVDWPSKPQKNPSLLRHSV